MANNKHYISLDKSAKKILSENEYRKLQEAIMFDKEMLKIWTLLLEHKAFMKLNQTKIADLMGVKQSQVSELEKLVKSGDFSKVTYSMTEKYANALNLHVQMGLVTADPIEANK